MNCGNTVETVPAGRVAFSRESLGTSARMKKQRPIVKSPPSSLMPPHAPWQGNADELGQSSALVIIGPV